MFDDFRDVREVEELARSDLALACEKARELVAANPEDEHSALLLREVVGKFSEGKDHDPVATDLAGAAEDVREAARLLEREGEEEAAEVLLRKHLAAHRNDPPAMRLMAEIAARCGFFENAERIARRGVELHPESVPMRLTLARILFYHRGEVEANREGDLALEIVEEALQLDPESNAALNLKGTFLAHLRRHDGALAAFEQALRLDPHFPQAWISVGLINKTLGRAGRAVAAFRTALAINPSLSQAWWELANLKTVKLFASDTPLIEAMLLDGESDLEAEQRAELHFALFKAYDDVQDVERAATHLITANALKKGVHCYDANSVSDIVDRGIATYTANFFNAHASGGSDSDELIFVLGMYRAGSTLVEQILSSHSKIEGTAELFYVQEMVTGIQASSGKEPEDFLATATTTQVAGLTEKLLELSRSHKRTNRPYFIDKNPVNWPYIGLIHALLPNARFIDVRRNPLDCCFANYAQNFSAGVTFSYDQSDLGRYYRDYLRMMRHFEPLLGDRYHRVIYEDLVDAPEREIRRLLDFLGLEFEESCLRFFETDRPVYTPSAQQVRRPINRSGIDRWRPYAQWLQPLIAELGDLPQSYRD